ncbi:MAG: ABC transporter permease [Candidatus Gottesmanbacteria bacterium]
MNVIYILWLRELKRYLRSRSRIIGSLGQPLLFLLALGLGLGPVFKKAGQGDYFQFLSPGVISMSILFTAIFSGVQVIWDRQFGFLKETLVAPVSRLQIMLGKTLGGATVATVQGIVVLLLTIIVGFRPYSLIHLPLAILFMFLMAILFTSIGTAIASSLEDMQGFQLIMNFLVQPIFFLSGALFPLTGLPPALKVITIIDPLSYGVDGLRYSLTGVSQLGAFNSLLVLSVLSLLALGIGSYLFSKIQI